MVAPQRPAFLSPAHRARSVDCTDQTSSPYALQWAGFLASRLVAIGRYEGSRVRSVPAWWQTCAVKCPPVEWDYVAIVFRNGD